MPQYKGARASPKDLMQTARVRRNRNRAHFCRMSFCTCIVVPLTGHSSLHTYSESYGKALRKHRPIPQVKATAWP
ncbi:hypothetical protein [Ensifer sp. MJa1]|uniref:hypothetical protein n=1 Tax=Ensifer sp. MJa1 TaxID=2919888 RepID=UPI003FA60BBF